MELLIIRRSLKIIWPIMVLYSIYFLMRGHNEPGGGFVGGLILALSLILLDLSSKNTPDILAMAVSRFPQILGIAILALISIPILPLAFNLPAFTALWTKIPLPLAGKLSSVLVFDMLVYIIVALGSVYSYFQLFSQAKEVNQ